MIQKVDLCWRQRLQAAAARHDQAPDDGIVSRDTTHLWPIHDSLQRVRAMTRGYEYCILFHRLPLLATSRQQN